MSACGSGGGSAGGDDSVDAVEAATTERAQEAIPLVSEALGRHGRQGAGPVAELHGHQLALRGLRDSLTAAEGETRHPSWRRCSAALVDAGYDDATQVDGHVTVDTGRHHGRRAAVPGPWRRRVDGRRCSPTCADYDGDDRERVENDEPRTLDGV